MNEEAAAAQGHAVADRHLHPATLLLGLIRNIPQFGLLIPALAWGGGRFPIGTALLIGVAALAVSGIIVYLRWTRFRFGLDEDELVIESGLVAKNRRAIPFDRIHDVNIERGPLHRILGLAKLTVETGASGGDEGDLDAVSLADAEAIRDAIRRHRAGLAPVAEGEEVAPVDHPVIYAMSPGRVILSGIFGFSLVIIAILGAVLNQIDNVIDLGWIFDVFESRASSYSDYILGHLLTSVLAFLAVFLTIGVVSGIIRSLLTDWGFTLTRTETGVRRVRGLFTRTDTVIPVKRVQAGIILSGPVCRALGWLRFAVQSVGGGGGQEDKKSGGQQVLMPLARPAEAAPLLGELELVEPPEAATMQPAGRAYLLRRLVWMLVAMIPLTVGLIKGEAWLLGAVVIFVLLAPPLWWLSGRNHRFTLTPDWLFVQNGWWGRKTIILPLAKVQTVSLDSGPIQRGLGSATLNIGVAGMRGAIAISDLPREAARDLLAPLAAKARGVPL